MGKRRKSVALAILVFALASMPIAGAIWLIEQAEREQIAFAQHAPASPLQRDTVALGAQTSAAVWTKYAAIAAVLGSAFGVIGVALVLATFRQAKRSADAAHDANRPWLELEVTPGDLWIGEDINLELHLTVANHGNSPATNVVVCAQMLLFCEGDPVNRQRVGPDTLVPMLDTARDSRRGTTIFPGRKDHFEEHGWATEQAVADARAKEQDVIPFVIAGVAYQSGRAVYYTVETYGVVIPDAYKRLNVSYAALIGDFELARHHNSYIT
jgi:hypothetical protein